MFGRNFFRVSNKRCTPFESLKGSKSFIMQEVNKEINGRNVVVLEKTPYITNEPLTPQTGVNAHMYHLPFMFKANMQLNASPAYLSLQGANPYETCRNVAGLARDFVNINVKEVKEDKQ